MRTVQGFGIAILDVYYGGLVILRKASVVFVSKSIRVCDCQSFKESFQRQELGFKRLNQQ